MTSLREYGVHSQFLTCGIMNKKIIKKKEAEEVQVYTVENECAPVMTSKVSTGFVKVKSWLSPQQICCELEFGPGRGMKREAGFALLFRRQCFLSTCPLIQLSSI
jgi:hypothetical protein